MLQTQIKLHAFHSFKEHFFMASYSKFLKWFLLPFTFRKHRTGHRELRPAPQPSLNLSWAHPGQGCTASSGDNQRGPQQWGKVAQSLLKTKILRIIKNESTVLISVSMMPAETVWLPSWEEAWFRKVALMKRNQERQIGTHKLTGSVGCFAVCFSSLA